MRVNYPAPQPEDPRTELLTAILVMAPYSAPEKKEEKKKAREGLRIKDRPDAMSEETHASSSHEEEQEDGGRRFPPHKKEGGIAGCRRGCSSSCPEEGASAEVDPGR